MLFNSYPPGVLVSPKLHPLGEAARISQFLASRVCQQQMFPAKGGYKTFVLFQSHLSGLPGDAAFGNTEHFSQLPVEGIVIVATHDGKHITVPKIRVEYPLCSTSRPSVRCMKVPSATFRCLRYCSRLYTSTHS